MRVAVGAKTVTADTIAKTVCSKLDADWIFILEGNRIPAASRARCRVAGKQKFVVVGILDRIDLERSIWRNAADSIRSGKIDDISRAQSMSGILDRLEKRGLIERFADPNDSRAKLARLTREGAALVARAQLA